MHLDDLADEAMAGNVARLFDETPRHHGDSLAIEASGYEMTHAELRTARRTSARPTTWRSRPSGANHTPPSGTQTTSHSCRTPPGPRDSQRA